MTSRLILPQRWVRQPPRAALAIDRSNPITRGLAGFGLPWSRQNTDIVRGTPVKRVLGSATESVTATRAGRVLTYAGQATGGQYGVPAYLKVSPSFQLTNGFAFLFAGRASHWQVDDANVCLTGLISANNTINGANVSGPVMRCGVVYDSSQGGRVNVGCVVGGTAHNLASASQIPLNSFFVVLGTYDGAILSIWLNGSLIASEAASGAVQNGNTYPHLSIGTDDTFNENDQSAYYPRGFSGDIAAWGVWERGLTPSEAAFVTRRVRNVYQLLEVPPRRIWMPPNVRAIVLTTTNASDAATATASAAEALSSSTTTAADAALSSASAAEVGSSTTTTAPDASLATAQAVAGITAVQVDASDQRLASATSTPAGALATTDAADAASSIATAVEAIVAAQTDASDARTATAQATEAVSAATVETADVLLAALIAGAGAGVSSTSTDAADAASGALAGALAVSGAQIDAADLASAALVSGVAIAATQTDQPDAGAALLQTAGGVVAVTTDATDLSASTVVAPLGLAVSAFDADDVAAAVASTAGSVALAVVEAGDIFVGSVVAVEVILAAQQEAADAGVATAVALGMPGGGTGASVADIWSFVLPTGLSAADTLARTYAWANDLARIHGLIPGEPLEVGTLFRTAGPVVQSVAEASGVVTVTRQ